MTAPIPRTNTETLLSLLLAEVRGLRADLAARDGRTTVGTPVITPGKAKLTTKDLDAAVTTQRRRERTARRAS